MAVSFDDWESGVYLAHHGIKGQKWGIRRYQNPDGSLTAEGKARKGQDSKTGSGRKNSESHIRKLESLKNGPERDKVANAFLKEFSDLQKERYDKANDAYDKALNRRTLSRKSETTNPRWAYNQALNEHSNTENGKRYQEQWNWLYNEIRKKSGSWYFSEGVSKGFKQYVEKSQQLRDAYNKRSQELRAKKHTYGSYERALKKDKVLSDITRRSNELDESLPGTVLKDIGFPDSPENRKRIRSLVFYD